jgi:hypothetical protein
MHNNPAFASSSAGSSSQSSSSLLYSITSALVERDYVAGPPYVAVAADMDRLVLVWAAVVVPVYQLTQEHLSEMFAYSVAAIHLQLPHQLSYAFMITDPHIVDKEGWSAIDAIPADQVCDPALRRGDEGLVLPEWKAHLPYTLHFCQRYYLGPYFFSKYRLPWDFLSCHHPLLLNPDEDYHPSGQPIALLYDSSITPDGTHYDIPAWQRPRQAYMLCHIIGTLNDAATFWKEQHCDDDPNTTTVAINLDKVYFVPRDRGK